MMSKNKKYGNIDPEDLLRYTGNGLSDEERYALERKLQKDPFAEEALEGLSSLSAEQAGGDLSRLEARLRKRVTGTRSMLWIRVAASVAILLTIGTLYLTVFTDKTGKMDRRVAETESAEPVREKGMPQDMRTMTEEAKTEKGAPDEDPGILGPEVAAAEPDLSATSVREEDLGEVEPAPGVEDKVIRADDETGDEDTFAYQVIKAEAVTDLGGAGTETEAELPSPGEEITVETTVTAPLTERVSMTQQTAMDETRAEEMAGIDAAEPERAERSAVRTGMDATKAKKLSGTGSARPVGGEELFNEYIAENIRFPEEDTTLTRGVVVLSFTIGPQGRPQNIEVEESPGDAFSREAIRLLKGGPEWLPAIENGIPIGEKTRLKIEFIKEKP